MGSFGCSQMSLGINFQLRMAVLTELQVKSEPLNSRKWDKFLRHQAENLDRENLGEKDNDTTRSAEFQTHAIDVLSEEQKFPVSHWLNALSGWPSDWDTWQWPGTKQM